MSELVIPAVGAGIGFLIPGIGPAVGWAVGSAISAYVNQPEGTEGPRVDDLSYSGSSYGIPVARMWGTCAVSGSYIWAPDIVETESTEGGKGGPSYTSFSYTGSFAVVFTDHEISGFRRIWFDTELVYDAQADPYNEGILKKKGINLNLYLGTSTQTADPVIEESEGAGNVSGYRGYSYIVCEDLALEKYGNKLPSSVRAEIVRDDSEANSNVVLTDGDGGSNVPQYSVLDDTFVTIDNSAVYRWNVASGEIVSISSTFTLNGAGAGAGWIIHPRDGLMYTWEWIPGGGANYYRPVIVDPVTGTTTYGNSAEVGSNNVEVDQIYPLYTGGAAYSLGPIGGSGIHIWTASDLGKTADQITYINTGNTPEFITEDSSGTLWWCDQATDIISVAGIAYDVSASLSITGPRQLRWHVPTQSMIVYADSGLYRISYLGATSSPVFSLDATGSGVPFFYESKVWMYEDTIWVGNGSTLWQERDIYDLSLIRTITMATAGWHNGLYTGQPYYHPYTHSIIGMGGAGSTDFNKYLLDRIPPGSQPLSTVVSQIAENLSASRKNVSGLNQTVRGFLMTRPEQNREAIRRLMVSHAFDACESDGKVKFIELDSGSVVVTIPEDDLAAHAPGTETPAQTKITRGQEVTFPKRTEIIALSRELEYETTAQGAGRQLSRGTGSVKLQLMEVLSDDEAAQLAEVLLHTPVIERNRHKFQTSNKYLYLHPLDRVIVTKDTTTHEVRLTERDASAGLLDTSAVSIDIESYTSAATGASGDGFIPTAIPDDTTSMTTQHLLDMPLLSELDAENVPGFYVGFTATYDGWPGAVLHKVVTADDAASAREMKTGTVEATAGHATSVLAHSDNTTTWDDVSTVTVRLVNGTLSSSTDAAVIAGANALGFAESGEIIQFVNVAASNSPDDGEYTLSRLLRGRRGTEHGTRKHTLGETVVLLTAATVYDVPITCNESESVFYTRAVTLGNQFLTSYAKTLPKNYVDATVLNGVWSYGAAYQTSEPGDVQNRIKPFSPVDPGASYDGSALTITWTRRTRLFIESEYKSVPLGENSEAYEIDLYDNDGTLVATHSATSESLTLTNAQLISDFGGVPAGLGFVVYQMSTTCNGGVAWRGWPLYSSTQDIGLFIPMYSDFSEYTADDTIADDWTVFSNPAATPLANVVSTSPYSPVWSYTPTGNWLYTDTSGSAAIAGWNNTNASADVEILLEFDYVGAFGYSNILGARMDTDDSYPQAAVCLSSFASPIEITFLWRTSAGGWNTSGFTGTSNAALTVAANTKSFYRFRLIGTRWQAKFWQTSLGSEPAWQLDATQTNVQAAGLVGIIENASQNPWPWSRIAIAWNGDTASFS